MKMNHSQSHSSIPHRSFDSSLFYQHESAASPFRSDFVVSDEFSNRPQRLDPASIQIAAGMKTSRIAQFHPTARYHTEAPNSRSLSRSSSRVAENFEIPAAGMSSEFLNARASEFRPQLRAVPKISSESEEIQPKRTPRTFEDSRPVSSFDSFSLSSNTQIPFKPSIKLIENSDRFLSSTGQRNPILQNSEFYDNQSHRPSKKFIFSQTRQTDGRTRENENSNFFHSNQNENSAESQIPIETRIYSNMESEQFEQQQFHSPPRETHRGKKMSPEAYRSNSLFSQAEPASENIRPPSAALVWSASRAPHSHRPVTSVPNSSRFTRSADCFQYDDGSQRVGLDFSAGGIARQREEEKRKYEQELEIIRNRLRQENQQRWMIAR